MARGQGHKSARALGEQFWLFVQDVAHASISRLSSVFGRMIHMCNLNTPVSKGGGA